MKRKRPTARRDAILVETPKMHELSVRFGRVARSKQFHDPIRELFEWAHTAVKLKNYARFKHYAAYLLNFLLKCNSTEEN